ncbi:MAG: TAT-variant-translocated molybdopterin oxidoreductase [Bacteroidia bacterium]|nr:TAT-variant-translocated molybdopterin oxidoreductase [Bacteroidia bacterium]
MSTKKYWKGLPELTQSPEFLEQQNNEFAENLPMEDMISNKAEKNEGTSRRDFLKFVGFTTAAAALASCETPVIKSIPYVVKPEEITPGVANFYASTFYDGNDFAPIWIKTREGRPIKVEGNELSPMTWGATNARMQASVLALYDSARLTAPKISGADKSWKDVDAGIKKELDAIKAANGKVVLLTSTIISPSTKAVIAELTAPDKYPNIQHVTYDAVSYSSMRFANKTVWDKNVIASYDFSKANVIVGIACDFLGNWISPVEFSAQYGKTRKVSKDKLEMSKHYHFESNLSLTGSNADERFPVKPSDFGKVAAALYNEVAKLAGGSAGSAVAIANKDANASIAKIAKELYNNKGKSLVVCGLNDNDTQVLVAGINKMLENYGKTLDADMPLNLRQGDDAAFIAFTKELNAGAIAGLMFYNCNPAYTMPVALVKDFAKAIDKKFTVSFSQVNDETAKLCKYVCPDHNFLESWGDANPKRGYFTLQQPAITPLFGIKRFADAGLGTRQFQDSLLAWAGKKDYYSYLQAYWQNHIFPMQGAHRDFWSFWSKSLHDGGVKVAVLKDAPIVTLATDSTGNAAMGNVVPLSVVVVNETDSLGNVIASNETIQLPPSTEVAVPIPSVDYSSFHKNASTMPAAAWEIHIYEKVSMGTGNQANNPWLQEMPDPITKVTWDNYVTMNPTDVKTATLNEMLRQDKMGSYVTVTANGVSFVLPVLPSPGQAAGTMGIALGYGRNADKFIVANGVGQNAFPMLSLSKGGNVNTISSSVSFAKAEGEHLYAGTQIHHTIMGREEQLLRETKLDIYKEQDRLAFNPPVMLATHEGDVPIGEVDLWDAHDRPGHKWAMNIDLNACIGCGSCVIACTTENNVAVVGKEEVSRTREMHWMRIDRYFTSEMNKGIAEKTELGAIDMYLQMETPSDNPKVTFQPIMCQHCNHAPCETVCPVLATNHSSEGINQMTYNRCIGTRYCANNCPFKVRRFNWWNYNDNPKFYKNPSQYDFGRMVLNPDVVVRSRGVMEKCSMCQQRLQAGKTTAKKAGVALKDGMIKTACQQACPTKAITFGDANDPESEISKARNDDRNYTLLEEVGVKATVSYMVKVRNENVTPADKEEAEYRKKRYSKKAEKESEKKVEKES